MRTGCIIMTMLLLNVIFNIERTAMSAATTDVVLKPEELYTGYDARKVIKTKDAVVLDEKVFKYGKDKKGWIVTDPISLIPVQDNFGIPGMVEKVEVELIADVPDGANVTLEVRTGKNSLEEMEWTDWQQIKGLKDTTSVEGRYIQIRVTLSANTVEKLPAIKQLTLHPIIKNTSVWKKSPKIIENNICKIIKSPITFYYERPDHPKLKAFREKTKLDEVIAKCKTDFETLVTLQNWIASIANERPEGLSKPFYPWDVDKLVKWKDDKPIILGHCMSYAAVMVDCASSLGYKARHIAVVGFREMSHEVVEAWVPSLRKWVFFDPSLAHYYCSKETGEPMNVLEIHNLIIDKLITDKKNMTWFISRDSKETREHVKKAGSKQIIEAKLGGWMYGKPMPNNYDWGWQHGYLAQGFFQMTPRNDFYSNTNAVSKKFESYPGYSNYPNWVDEKTPPRKGGENWFTRPRDFYWTVDEASFVFVQDAKEGTLNVELGHCMPFFAKYEIKIDGQTVTPQLQNSIFKWELKKGNNRIEITPIDEFGKRGRCSSAIIQY